MGYEEEDRKIAEALKKYGEIDSRMLAVNILKKIKEGKRGGNKDVK